MLIHPSLYLSYGTRMINNLLACMWEGTTKQQHPLFYGATRTRCMRSDLAPCFGHPVDLCRAKESRNRQTNRTCRLHGRFSRSILCGFRSHRRGCCVVVSHTSRHTHVTHAHGHPYNFSQTQLFLSCDHDMRTYASVYHKENYIDSMTNTQSRNSSSFLHVHCLN